MPFLAVALCAAFERVGCVAQIAYIHHRKWVSDALYSTACAFKVHSFKSARVFFSIFQRVLQRITLIGVLLFHIRHSRNANIIRTRWINLPMEASRVYSKQSLAAFDNIMLKLTSC